jgi:hypothetical protein
MLRRSTLTRSMLVASVFAGTACIPYHRTEPLSPPVVGSIRYSDNAPASGMLVAVVGSNWRHPCRDATHWVTTDQQGNFEVPASYVQTRWLLILPPMERFFSVFDVCVGRDSSSLTAAYTGRALLRGGEPTDTVRCILWTAGGSPQQSCAGRSQQSVHTSGSWTTATSNGFYRLLVPTDDSRAQEAKLQWVQRLDGDGERVVDSLALPLAPMPLQIERAELHASAASTCVIVRSAGGKAHWYSNPQVVATILDLGPPGHATPRPRCGRS